MFGLSPALEGLVQAKNCEGVVLKSNRGCSACGGYIEESGKM